MKSLNKIRFLTIITAFMILLAAIVFSFLKTDHEKEFMEELSFTVMVDGKQIELVPWEDEEEQIYYLFLPSGIRETNPEIVVSFEKGIYNLVIDGVSYNSGDILNPVFEEKNDAVPIDMELTGPFGVSYMSESLKILCSENVPSLLVTVEDVEELLSEAEFDNKKYIETGRVRILDENGNFVGEQELKQFKVRGNLTATLDKKPFKLCFDEPTGMFGMSPAVNWNLLANATDGSYIRNKLVLDLANSVTGAYEPDGEFVELYLNGSYQGLYLLTEAVEIGENRLDIPLEDNFLLEMELDFRQEENATYVTTKKGQLFDIETEGKVSEKESEQVREFLNDVESALSSENGVSEISGKPLEELIDFDSWANAWLIEEISGDHDTGIASQFAYTLKESEKMKLYAGPVWDYDGAMGNVNTPLYRNPKALTTSIEQTRPEGNANQNRWLSAMYRNECFRQVLEEKYTQIFDQQLQTVLDTKIDGYVETIRRSACLDALRWHEKRLSWQFVLPSGLSIPEEGDYRKYDTLDENVVMVREFLSAKREFLYGLFAEHRDYCVVEVRNDAPFLNQDYNQTVYYWVERGTAIENLPLYQESGYEFTGYYDKEKGNLITDGSLIYEDCILEGRWEQTGEE